MCSPSEAELTQLSEIERACFSQPLTIGQLASLVKQDTTNFFAVCEDGTREPVGSIWLQAVLDEGYIGNVAVRPEFRRRGAASALLAGIDEFALRKRLRFVTLEVRASNKAAIALYEKHGYIMKGIRRGYYSNPKEDAHLMTKEFETDRL